MNLEQLLRRRGLPFATIFHNSAFDAQRLAQAVHVAGDNVAKTVLLHSNRGYVIAVLQATHQIDFEKARRALAVHWVELATELEFHNRFPDCEIGAPPPFGSLYGMRTLVDGALAKDEEIVFKGNTNEEAICMKYDDFAAFEEPLVADFSFRV
jgi:Ala-tRNA(Pro) deacylase